MSLSSEALNLCKENGGFWEFIKTPEFTFYRDHAEALENILHEYKEYKFCKGLQKDRFFNGEELLWTTDRVKEYLRNRKIKYSKREKEYILRKMAYAESKKELKHNFDKAFGDGY